MPALTQIAPRAAWLVAVIAVTTCAIAAPAAAQQSSALQLTAPRFGRDPAAVRVTPVAPRAIPDARPAPQQSQLGVRILAESGVELLTLGVSVATPALIAGLSARNCAGELVCIGPEAWATVFGALGGILGEALVPPLLSAVGSALGGRGDVGAAYLGMLVGDVAAGLFIAGGLLMKDDGALVAMAALAGLSLLAGPIVGYEISSATAARGAPRITPTIAFTQDGTQVGAMGRF